jgi:hypothetical protein
MDRWAQLALNHQHRKRYKCPAINHLRGKADKAKEGPWRIRASLLKSYLAIANVQNALGSVQGARFEVLR